MYFFLSVIILPVNKKDSILRLPFTAFYSNSKQVKWRSSLYFIKPLNEKAYSPDQEPYPQPHLQSNFPLRHDELNVIFSK